MPDSVLMFRHTDAAGDEHVVSERGGTPEEPRYLPVLLIEAVMTGEVGDYTQALADRLGVPITAYRFVQTGRVACRIPEQGGEGPAVSVHTMNPSPEKESVALGEDSRL